MSKQRLYCKMCQTALSLPLHLDQNVREVHASCEDDSIFIPMEDAWIVELSPTLGGPATEKHIWFSPKALTEGAMTDRQTFGCCGYTGLGNTRCKCGHVVGSRIDECGFQPRFAADPQMTYWAASHFAEA